MLNAKEVEHIEQWLADIVRTADSHEGPRHEWSWWCDCLWCGLKRRVARDVLMLLADLSTLQSDLTRAKVLLRYYGDRENYTTRSMAVPYGKTDEPVTHDAGARARDFLKTGNVVIWNGGWND